MAAWDGPAGPRLDQLAEESVRAGEQHGIPSREHDAAMDAWAEHAEEREPEAG
jgi:hypothetical protein